MLEGAITERGSELLAIGAHITTNNNGGGPTPSYKAGKGSTDVSRTVGIDLVRDSAPHVVCLEDCIEISHKKKLLSAWG